LNPGRKIEITTIRKDSTGKIEDENNKKNLNGYHKKC